MRLAITTTLLSILSTPLSLLSTPLFAQTAPPAQVAPAAPVAPDEFGSSTTAEAAATPQVHPVLAGYVEFLEREGYRPEIDGDGDVVFKREGRVYFVPGELVSNDDEYFAIRQIAFNIQSDEERAMAYVAASNANFNTKVAKVVVKHDRVWISCECFIDEPDSYRAFLERTLEAIDFARDQFLEDVQRQTNASA